MGLLARVKVNEASFAADYSPELHFASVCVNYNPSTIAMVKQWNVMSYYFPNCHIGIFNLRQSTYPYCRLCISLGI